MALVLQGAGNTTAGAGGSTTMSAAVGTASNRVLVVGIAASDIYGSPIVSSMTYDGTAMTLGSHHSGYAQAQSCTYYLINPNSGTHNLVVNWAVAFSGNKLVSYLAYSGADQITGCEGAVSAASTPYAVTSTISVTSRVGSVVLDAITASAGSLTFDPSQSVLLNWAGKYGTSYKTSTSTSTNMTANFADSYYSHSGISVIPLASARRRSRTIIF